jgi:hypothetical protein
MSLPKDADFLSFQMTFGASFQLREGSLNLHFSYAKISARHTAV